MIAKTAPSCQRLKPNNPPPARSPPRAMAARAQGTRRPRLGGRNGEAATIVERRAGATDEACGRSDPTAPPPSAAGPQDRARAAWIGDAAWPAARVAGPRRNARARRARDTMRDQDQPIEILRFRVRKTGDNRKDRADPQIFPTSAGLRDQRDQHVGSLYVPFKGGIRRGRY
jgi:hypothetical protein